MKITSLFTTLPFLLFITSCKEAAKDQVREAVKLITTYNQEVTIWKRQQGWNLKNTIDIYNDDPSLTPIK